MKIFKNIISNIDISSKDFIFIKLGFITCMFENENENKTQIGYGLVQKDFDFYYDFLSKIQKYEDQAGIMSLKLDGTRIHSVNSFFTDQFDMYIDNCEIIFEKNNYKNHFHSGFLGALICLLKGKKDKEYDIENLINYSVLQFKNTKKPNTIEVTFNNESEFVYDGKSYSEYLQKSNIRNFNEFLIALNNLLIIQDNVQNIPEIENLKAHQIELNDSLSYAKYIQNALLPRTDVMNDILDVVNIFYKPKEIVSGDFYFYRKVKNGIVIGIGDCTGHGVPGALLTALSISEINNLTETKNEFSPSKLLSELNKKLYHSLNGNNIPTIKNLINEVFLGNVYNPEKSTNIVKDGLDIAVCYIQHEYKKVTFCGAGLPLYIVGDNSINIVKQKENKGIGGLYNFQESYKENEIYYNDSEYFVLSTDGIIDQFGGGKGKKLKSKNFLKFIKAIGNDPDNFTFKYSVFLNTWISSDNLNVDEILDNVKNNTIQYNHKKNITVYEQIDDITVLSFKP